MADPIKHIQVPIKVLGGERWGQLSYFGDTHLICGETVKQKDEKYSFAGGHRVRLYSFKKNVHWKIPEGISLDIAAVPAAPAPRRTQR
jgi:hypothetical protein